MNNAPHHRTVLDRRTFLSTAATAAGALAGRAREGLNNRPPPAPDSSLPEA